MTDRNINITATIDDSSLKGFGATLDMLSSKVTKLEDNLKSLGSAGMHSLGGVGGGQAAARAGTSASSGGSGNGIGSASRIDNYLRDLNRWAGSHDRKFDQMIGLLGRLSASAGRGGGGEGPGDFGGGGGGRARGRRARSGWGALRDDLNSDRRRVGAFAMGGVLSQVGSQMNGPDGYSDVGSHLQMGGQILQGAAAGGPVGAVVSAWGAIDEHVARRDAFDDRKRGSLIDERMQAREAARRRKEKKESEDQTKFEYGLEADLSLRSGPDGAAAARASREKANNRRLGVLDENITNWDKSLPVLDPKQEKSLSADQRKAYKDEEARAQEKLNGFLMEEAKLRKENVGLAAQARDEAEAAVEVSRRGFNSMNREKGGLYADLEGARSRLEGNQAEFGQLGRSQQRKTSRIAEKLDRGEQLTKSEERFAAKSDLLQEDARKIFAKKAEESGNFSEGLKRRAGGLQIQQVEGQIKLLEERLKQGIQLEAELVIDKQKAQAKVEALRKELEASGTLKIRVEVDDTPAAFSAQVITKNAAGG